MGLEIADQVPHLDVKSICNQLKRPKCHALPAGFDPVQMHAVQPGQLRKLVLRHALFAANRFDIPANEFLNVLQRLQPRAYAVFKHPA